MNLRRAVIILAFVIFSHHLTRLARLFLPLDNSRPGHSDGSNGVGVIIMAYPRSGSSLLGHLLSVHNESRYLFEPLYYLEKVFKRKNLKISVSRWTQRVIEGAFHCQPYIMSELLQKESEDNFKIFRAGSLKACSETPVKVIKVIRMRRFHALPWIKQTNYKIVHLIRDPRAILHSMRQKPDRWAGKMRADRMCANMKDDLILSTDLPEHQYYLLKYEALMTNITEELKRVYQFLGLAFTPEVEEAIHECKNSPDKNSDGPDGNYFSVYRGADFDFNSWKKDMHLKDVLHGNKICRELLQATGYSSNGNNEKTT